MSKLSSMKSPLPGGEGNGSVLYTAAAVLLVAFFFWAVYSLIFPPVSRLDLDKLDGNGQFTGNADAKVRIVEFSDFECYACGIAEPVVRQVLSEYAGKVKFTYRHFPLPQHVFAQKAAEASECAAEQGKFWEVHKKLFENQTALDIDSLKKYALDLGLDLGQFSSCLASGRTAPKVAADLGYGNSIRINKTPTFFINGSELQDISIKGFREAIDSELAK